MSNPRSPDCTVSINRTDYRRALILPALLSCAALACSSASGLGLAPTATPLPPTATARPSSTPRPTATATPLPGQISFAADFGDMNSWPSFSIPRDKSYSVQQRAGGLYVEVNSADSSAYLMSPFDFSSPDIQIEADVKITDGPNRNNISLLCRATRDGWYEFSILTGGLYDIWRFDGRYTSLVSGGSNAIRIGRNQTNHLTAVCQGNQLTFFANNVELTSIRDTHFEKTGSFGFSVSAFDIPGVGVVLDRLVAGKPANVLAPLAEPETGVAGPGG